MSLKSFLRLYAHWSYPTFTPRANFLRRGKINENYACGWINDLWMYASLYILRCTYIFIRKCSKFVWFDLFIYCIADKRERDLMFYICEERKLILYESKHHALLSISRVGNCILYINLIWKSMGKFIVILQEIFSTNDKRKKRSTRKCVYEFLTSTDQVVTSMIIGFIPVLARTQNNNYILMRLCRKASQINKTWTIRQTHTTNLIS